MCGKQTDGEVKDAITGQVFCTRRCQVEYFDKVS